MTAAQRQRGRGRGDGGAGCGQFGHTSPSPSSSFFFILSVARWQNLIPSFPWIAPGWRAWGRNPPWRNPRKGRDQILQRTIAEPLSFFKPEGTNTYNLKIWLSPSGNHASSSSPLPSSVNAALTLVVDVASASPHSFAFRTVVRYEGDVGRT